MLAQRQDSFIQPKNIKPIEGFDAKDYRALRKIGIDIDTHVVNAMSASKTLRAAMNMAMDAIQPSVTTGSMGAPVQFLQQWLPGFVKILTNPMKLDTILGMNTVAQWHQEEVVQAVMERLGNALPYGDTANSPNASWNVNYERRTVVRFEQGMSVGPLEEARAAEMQVDSASMKREACALMLEIVRNLVGFYGYNSGLNRTYGLLSDPNLPAYVTVATGASSSTLWANKTYLEINKDIRAAVAALQNQSQDNINPEDVDTTMVVATAVYQYLTVTPDFGNSVKEWIQKTYPRMRIVSTPEFNAANGGANVFYIFADSVQDSSSDNGRTFDQLVATKFKTLGVQQKVKGFKEGYTNGTAGVICKRPFAVVRRSGV